MREILFRGKRADDGEWIEGGYFKYDKRTYITVEKENIEYKPGDTHIASYEAISKTVGQFTGILDKKGVKVFEGDILVNALREQDTRKFLVQWDIKCSRFLAVTKPLELGPCDNRYLWYVGDELNKNGLIIGNIHDNSELAL